MTELLRKAIIDGNDNITINVGAADLRSIIAEMVQDELTRRAQAVEANKEKPTLSRKEAADMLGVTFMTLNRWARDEYLVPVKIGYKVRYRLSDVENILLNRNSTNN